ncbi:DUF1731 domain-containing protein [Plesiomonas shigelloides subsp. oncorhynchi]|nr:DUF1731 domain-containing protein [Plesiomonas shigelloides]
MNKAGFHFRYTDLHEALASLLKAQPN